MRRSTLRALDDSANMISLLHDRMVPYDTEKDDPRTERNKAI